MNKYIALSIAWGIAITAFAYFFEGAMDGVSYAFIVLALAPILEESVKFIAYRSVLRYTIFIPIAFMVGETSLVMHDHLVSSPLMTVGDATSYLLWGIFIGALLLKHVATWTVSWLSNFRWYALPLAILSHFLWNVAALWSDNTQVLNILSAVVYVPVFFALAKYGYSLRRGNGTALAVEQSNPIGEN